MEVVYFSQSKWIILLEVIIKTIIMFIAGEDKQLQQQMTGSGNCPFSTPPPFKRLMRNLCKLSVPGMKPTNMDLYRLKRQVSKWYLTNCYLS